MGCLDNIEGGSSSEGTLSVISDDILALILTILSSFLYTPIRKGVVDTTRRHTRFVFIAGGLAEYEYLRWNIKISIDRGKYRTITTLPDSSTTDSDRIRKDSTDLEKGMIIRVLVTTSP